MKFGIYDSESVRMFEELKHRIIEQEDSFKRYGDLIYFKECLPHRRIINIWPGAIDYEILELLVSLAKTAGDSKVFYEYIGSESVSYEKDAPDTSINQFQIPVAKVKQALAIGISREIYQGRKRGEERNFQGADLFISETCKWAIAYTPITKYSLFAGTNSTAAAFDQWQARNDNYYSVQEFLKDLSDYGCGFRVDRIDGFYDWPLRLMIHAYGQKKAVDLMRGFDLIVD